MARSSLTTPACNRAKAKNAVEQLLVFVQVTVAFVGHQHASRMSFAAVVKDPCSTAFTDECTVPIQASGSAPVDREKSSLQPSPIRPKLLAGELLEQTLVPLVEQGDGGTTIRGLTLSLLVSLRIALIATSVLPVPVIASTMPR